MAGSQAAIEIRQLSALDEFADVLRLQRVIWGFDDVELLPVRFLVVVCKVGGHVFGAFDGAEGFVIGDLTGPGEDPKGRTDVFAERLLPLDVPLVFGAPFGHAGRNQPVLLGAPHALDADAGRLIPLAA